MKNNIKAKLGVVAATAFNFLMPFSTFADSGVSRAQGGVSEINNKVGAATDLNSMISTILNAVFGLIGILAVIMIVLGGVNYTISQGDPGKIKKAKDTILYGIIGLIVALLAFAIVSFVLSALQQ